MSATAKSTDRLHQHPELAARWHQILYSPLDGGTERITAGFAIRAEDGAVHSHPVINRRLARCLFGDHYQEALELVNMAINSAHRHLERAFTLDNWIPPLGGFSVGLQSDAVGYDIDHVLQQAIAMSTALATPLFEVSESEETRDTKQWIRLVKTSLTSTLRGYFDKKIHVGKIRETIGFFAEPSHYAAHFSVFRHDSSHLGAAFSAAQSKLWKLDQLRDRLPLLVSRTELIVGHISAQEEQLSEQVKDYIEELSEEAAKREIPVREAMQPTDAASALEQACRLAS